MIEKEMIRQQAQEEFFDEPIENLKKLIEKYFDYDGFFFLIQNFILFKLFNF
jgi:hypothetical protein